MRGGTVAALSRQADVNESTLRKGVNGARVVRSQTPDQPPVEDPAEGTSKSQRRRTDAEVAVGMGTACIRATLINLSQFDPVAPLVTSDFRESNLLATLPYLRSNTEF